MYQGLLHHVIVKLFWEHYPFDHPILLAVVDPSQFEHSSGLPRMVLPAGIDLEREHQKKYLFLGPSEPFLEYLRQRPYKLGHILEEREGDLRRLPRTTVSGN